MGDISNFSLSEGCVLVTDPLEGRGVRGLPILNRVPTALMLSFSPRDSVSKLLRRVRKGLGEDLRAFIGQRHPAVGPSNAAC